MKAAIHPTYFPDAQIVCACGNVFKVGSTQKEIRVELCSKCHPFYTGKQKLVDTARRVEKFAEKVAAKTTSERGSKKAKTVKRAAQKEAKKAQKKPTRLDETANA
jgi:large subunit ribosomal protein L31